ncbi:Lipoprotein OS=Kitasatospora aureofaciens OX=1894 GN=GCM10010502_17370 PE=4 SV=1 [Kitasatospora aureofaciens]
MSGQALPTCRWRGNAQEVPQKDTKDVCGVNDVGFEPVGADKTAAFAPTAKGHLSSVLVAPKDVNLADLVKHINECLATPYNEKGSYPCSAGDYKVAVDASGKVTELWERAHS